MVSADDAKPGSGYAAHMKHVFIRCLRVCFTAWVVTISASDTAPGQPQDLKQARKHLDQCAYRYLSTHKPCEALYFPE